LLLTLPAAGWALSVQDQIVEQLTAQGFYELDISRTLLGRTRIVAISADYRREIVFNPATGEILRDYVAALDNSNTQPKVFIPSVSNANSHSNGGSGGGTSLGQQTSVDLSGGDHEDEDHASEDPGDDGQDDVSHEDSHKDSHDDDAYDNEID